MNIQMNEWTPWHWHLWHFASLHYLRRIFIFKFVHHHFWPKLLQELRHLLWFVLIIIFSCGASQNTNVLMIIFFLQWAIWLIYHQKIMKLPPSPQIENTFFTLFSIYIVLHGHVKPYKCFFLTLTFTLFYTT